MMALHSRLTKTMFVLACALCALGLIRARAQEVTTASENSEKCATAGAPLVDPLSAPHWNGWGVDSSQHRFQPSIMAQLAPDDVPRLKVKWAFGFSGAVRAFAQPTIVAGRLFVGSQNGKVYSLDSDSGCIYWEFDAGRPVRSAVVIGQQAGSWSAYFGDFGANVHALDALTGRELWKARIDDHPAARVTGSPALIGATLFVRFRQPKKELAPTRPIRVAVSAAASSRWRLRRGSCSGRVIPSRTRRSRPERTRLASK
jgi:PQQ-like domain